MERSSHSQHRLRSLSCDRCWHPPEGPDSTRVALSPAPRPQPMLVLGDPPAKTSSSSTSTAQIRSIDHDHIASSDPWRRTSDHTRERRVEAGLAAWQQIVLGAYIEKHIGELITIRVLARFVYLSAHRFTRAFKYSFGVSLRRYLLQRRIERAKALLAKPAWSIPEISLALGFNRTTSFSAAFRTVTGASPSAYRRTRE